MYTALVLAGEDHTVSGTPYQLLPSDSAPHLAAVIAAAQPAAAATVVLLGSRAEKVLGEVEMGDAAVVIDDDWQRGPFGTLRVGLDFLERSDQDALGALVLAATLPAPPPELCNRLVELHHEEHPLAVVVKYRYTPGYPVLLDRKLWPKLMSMEHDGDLVDLLNAHTDWVGHVWVEDTSPRPLGSPEPV